MLVALFWRVKLIFPENTQAGKPDVQFFRNATPLYRRKTLFLLVYFLLFPPAGASIRSSAGSEGLPDGRPAGPPRGGVANAALLMSGATGATSGRLLSCTGVGKLYT